MYLKHYNLRQLPFRNTPDPQFFLETPKHVEALANLIYAVEQRRGFVMLTGEIGSGKTLVTHLLLRQIEDHALIALIRNTHLNSTQLIRLICDEFSVRVKEDADKASMLLSLNQFLVQQLSEDRLVVILIDEAQNLSDKVLEELRMLSNLETSSEKLIQIVLVGQPELREKVTQPNLEQLRQRIALSYHLEPLTHAEAVAYIEHRLKIAGPEHKAVLTPGALEKIYRFSKGTPRVINTLCDNALLYGFTAGVTTLDETLVDKVLRQSMPMAPKQRIGPVRTPTFHPPVPEEKPAAEPAHVPGNTARGLRGASSVPASANVPPAAPPAVAVPAVPPAPAKVIPPTAAATPVATPVMPPGPHAAKAPEPSVVVVAAPMPVAAVAPAPASAAVAASAPVAAPVPMAAPMPAPMPVASPAPAPAPAMTMTVVPPMGAPSAGDDVITCVPVARLFGLSPDRL